MIRLFVRGRLWVSLCNQLRNFMSQGTIDLIAGQIVVVVAAVFINVLAARRLEPADRGLIAAILQVGFVAATIVRGGLDTAFITAGLNRHWEPLLRLSFHMIVRPLLGAALTLVSCLGAFLLAGRQHQGAPAFISAVVACAVASLLARCLRAAYLGTGNARLMLWYRSVSQLVPALVSVVVYLLGHESVVAWSIPFIFAQLVVTGTWILVALTRNASERATISDVSIHLMRERSRRTSGAAIASQLTLRLDRLLLPLLADTAALGLYVMAATLTETVVSPVQSYVDGRLPLWAIRHRAHTFSKHAQRRLALRWLLVCVGAATAVGFVAWIVLPTLLGPRYAASKELVPPLALGAALFGWSRILNGLLVSSDRPELASRAEVASVTVAAAMYLLLIPRLGAMGAAVGSIGGYAIGGGIMFLMLRDAPK